MVEPIVLYWAKKFREICSDESLTPIQVISEFHLFCKQEENALAERWEQKLNEPKEQEPEEEIIIDEVPQLDRDVMEFPRKKN